MRMGCGWLQAIDKGGIWAGGGVGGWLQAITDRGHAIPFPATGLAGPVEKELVDVLRRTLDRDPARRPTIPQLRAHRWLVPVRPPPPWRHQGDQSPPTPPHLGAAPWLPGAPSSGQRLRGVAWRATEQELGRNP